MSDAVAQSMVVVVGVSRIESKCKRGRRRG